MDEAIVLAELYNRYIEPTKRKKDKFIGIEIEMPVINLNGEAVDFSVVHNLTNAFEKQFKMGSAGVDEEGNTYSLKNFRNGDNLSYDCSYNNLEISMGKEKDLNILNGRFKTYYFFIEEFLKTYNYTLSGLGINPYHNKNNCVPILNERYRMLFHYLGEYKKYIHPDYFHSYPEFGTFSSASQVHIDVDYYNLVDTINTFSKLEPIKALMFSNSVMPEEEKGVICVRDMLWENSMHGINPKNTGMFEHEFTSETDLFEYIKQTSMYCTMRNGKYINFSPVPVLDYFNSSLITGEFFNGSTYEDIQFEPQISDLQYHRSFKHEELTPRGTIEFRSCCCQPIADSMTVAAFHVGLYEELEKLKELIDNDNVIYGHGLSMVQLRKLFCYGKIPEFINGDELQSLILSVLDIAREGLYKRRYDEAHFLNPLYERAFRRTNPALEYISDFTKGTPINELISRYAKIC